MKRLKISSITSRRILVYVESPSYWVYFKEIVERLIHIHDYRISYVTSDAKDPFLQNPPEGILPYYIGSGSIRTYTFATLEADLVLMTSPDLETSYIKRSKLTSHYLYLPHTMNSMHMIFRKNALSGFDTVFCVGPHQKRELLEARKLYDLKPQKLVEGGYVRLDAMLVSAKNFPTPEPGEHYRVVIAPTWGPNALIAFGCEALIDAILKAGHSVIMRPHRVSEVEDAHQIEKLDRLFGSYENFHWSKDLPSRDPYFGAHVLITDWSGSAFSFGFGLGRPVLFVDLPKKINNREFAKFKNEPLEVFLRSEMGKILPAEQMDQAHLVLSELCSGSQEWSARLSDLRNRWCYRIGNSVEFAATYISDLSDDIQRDKMS